MTEELISIIIPAYNIQDFIKDCVISVMHQTYHNLEILLIDDGSTDNTGTICDSLSSIDSRIKVIHQPNGGLSDARNTGISMAEGKWLFFLDGDDCLFPMSIELLYNAATKKSASIAIGSYLTFCDEIHEPELTSSDIQMFSGKEAAGMIYYNKYYINFITAWAKLFRKDCFQFEFPRQRYHEDEFIMYRALYEQELIVFIPTPVYGYRKRPGSITQSFSSKNLDKLDALEEQCLFWKQNNEKDYLSKASKRYLTYIMSCTYKCYYIQKSDALKNQMVSRFRSAYNIYLPYISKIDIFKLMYKIFYHAPSLCIAILHFAIKTHLFSEI